MSTKQILMEVAKKLPENASIGDAIYELEFRQAIEDGLASLDRGERIPLEEARKRISKYSSVGANPHGLVQLQALEALQKHLKLDAAKAAGWMDAVRIARG